MASLSHHHSAKSSHSDDSDYNGCAIVFWYFDPNKNAPILLVGKESVYVSDLLKESEFKKQFGELLEKSQHFDSSKLSGFVNEKDRLQAAKDYFSNQSNILEKTLRIGRIQFDTPSKNGNVFTVNYRYLPKDFKRGIIKGRKESVDSSDTIKTIVREVAEEFGVNISSGEKRKIMQIGQYGNYSRGDHYKLFALEIENPEVFTFFINRISQRVKSKNGELFEFSFKPVTEIRSQFDQYNSKTKAAIDAFEHAVLTKTNSSASKSPHNSLTKSNHLTKSGGTRRKKNKTLKLRSKTIRHGFSNARKNSS